MEKIASFTVDHIRLIPGVYVSRKDSVGDSVVTTFDLRMTRTQLKFMLLSIWVQHFSEIIRSMRPRSYISDLWDAVPAST